MRDPDDLPIFRPRIGGGRKSRSRGEATTLRSAVLSAGSYAVRRAVSRAAARSRIAVTRPTADARRVVVKAHVARLGRGGAKAASLHLRYIQRDGVEKDGSKGVLYNADGPAPAGAFEEPRIDEKHQFRLIVSPEDADELDLTDYVRRLMTRAERDLGRKLEWAAVNHHNTDHPHAHIVIRGVDREGREVRLDRGYISNGLRWRAQEIATEELGPRRELDVRRARAKEIAQERFTSLDREIERRAKDSSVEVRSPSRASRINESTVVARLEHLESMRLAERQSPTSWRLAEGWQAHLREVGSRGDILKQIHAAISGDPARYRIVRVGQAIETEGTHPGVVTGRVASKGLSDELKGVFYAVIETPTGSAYHVPIDSRSADALRPGDVVSLTTKPEPPLRPVDREIAAAAKGGVYAIERLEPTAAQAHGRRLRELERLGLATPVSPGRWNVSPQLLEQLERRHLEAPVRHRLLLHKEPLSVRDQVRHPGPVWLDGIKTDSLAPYGFGAVVRTAVQERRGALRELGVTPDDPNRSAKLQELERRAIGMKMATRSGQAFVADAPDAFRGLVHCQPGGPSPTSYAVVSDGARFLVLRSTSALQSLQGQAVTVMRDANGRLVVRAAPDRGLER
jgi:type IV secretory pathway VirD2 relaxase